MAATTAAISMFPDFTGSTIGMRLPKKKVWFESLKADPKTNIFLDVVEKLGLSELRSNLNKLNSVYRSPAHLGNFYLEHGVL